MCKAVLKYAFKSVPKKILQTQTCLENHLKMGLMSGQDADACSSALGPDIHGQVSLEFTKARDGRGGR